MLIVGLPLRLHGPCLFLWLRRSNAQRLPPYLWRGLGLSLFVWLFPFFVCINGKLNLFPWDTPDRCGVGGGAKEGANS